jgi:hypothetical protein
MALEGVELRCALKDATTMGIAAPAAKTKGDCDVLKDLVVFYLDNAAAVADLVAVCFEAKMAVFPKTGGLLVNAGDRVYWNDANKLVTKTATDRPIGWGVSRDDNAGVAGAAADSDVWVRFLNNMESAVY